MKRSTSRVLRASSPRDLMMLPTHCSRCTCLAHSFRQSFPLHACVPPNQKSSSCPCKTTLPIFKGFSHDRVRQHSMEQNIEDPVDIKVSKILARKVSRQSKNVRQEQISEGRDPGLSKTSSQDRMLQRTVEQTLPKLINMDESWTLCSQK